MLLCGANVFPQSAQDGLNPGTNGPIFAVAVQPDGKIVIGGQFTGVGGQNGDVPRSRIARINLDGTLDTTFDPGASPNQISALAIQPDGKIIVAGDFNVLGGGGFGNTPRSKIGRLNPDGTVDPSFNPGANGSIQAVLLQPDGKILIGGFFTTVGGGGTGLITRHRIARLNPDGTVDLTFNPGANGTVREFALQRDGRIVMIGDFTTIGTAQRRFIARVNADGGLDTTFNPGATNPIVALAVQPDGKIIVGGGFTALGGGTGITTRHRIGRIHPNGTIDIAFNPGADFSVNELALQPDGDILVGGLFDNIGGGGTGTIPRNNLARLKSHGGVDMSFNPGVSGLIHVFNVQPDRKIIVAGAFANLGSAVSGHPNIGRLYPDGSVDLTLNINPDGGGVFATALQPDGKILIGGSFTTINDEPHRRIARLNPDGKIDPSFQVQALGGFFNAGVYTIAVQPDGKILIGGEFSSVSASDGGPAVGRNNIARLNQNGTIDMTFDPGANDIVRSLSVQADGKILVGGLFTTLGASPTSRNRLGRLNANGTVDTSFDPGANAQVLTLVLQRDGKILAGGEFTMIGGGGTGTTPRNFIARLNSDGAVDAAFNPGANSAVFAFAVQPDEKIIVAGAFTKLGGGGLGTTTRNHVGRLNAGGDVDETYVPSAGSAVATLALQSDGKLIVGGIFNTLGTGAGARTRNRIGKFNTDGSVNDGFDPGAGAEVNALALQADGKVLVGGGFITLGGGGVGTASRRIFGRLTNNDAAAAFQFVHPAGTAVAYSSFSGGPEITRVLLASSTDGISFTPLGDGTRHPQSLTVAWVLDGVSLPLNQNFFLRSRGFYNTGERAASASIIELVDRMILCPTIDVNPTTANLTGGVAGQSYAAQQFMQTGGSGPITFSVSAGALPNGLAVSAAGLLAGTPTQAGTFNFTIQATDQNGCFGARSYSLEIECPEISIGPLPGPVPNGTTGAAYSQQFTQTGGIGTITFTKVDGNFPAGLSLSSSGLLSGTPREAGTFLFTIQATDQNGCTRVSTYQIHIVCATIIVSPQETRLPNAIAGSSFSQTFTQSGGTLPVTFSSSALPQGLTFNSQTGVLSGIPTQIGAFGIGIGVIDANGCSGGQSYALEVKTGIRLSEAAYSIGEGGNALTITAIRTGNTELPSSAKFTTSDTAGLTTCTIANGKASERCDYATTLGTLVFGKGETSRTFVIPIVDDALVEGNETFTVTVSDVTNAFPGEPQTAVVTITDNDAVPASQNPIDGVGFFVTQQYIDFLGRLPDSVGFANWTQTLGGCPNGGFGEFDNPTCDRVHVSSGFFLSTEFRERGYFAYRFYEVALDRRPAYAEFVPDMAQVGGAQSPESEVLSKAAYTQEWTQRSAFKARYDALSNQAFVDALEANAEVTLANKATLVAALNVGATNRGQVLRDIVETQAVADRFFNRAFVTMQYFGYLRRDPDSIGFQNWLNTLNANPDNFRHMIFGFLFSTEYRQRFGL